MYSLQCWPVRLRHGTIQLRRVAETRLARVHYLIPRTRRVREPFSHRFICVDFILIQFDLCLEPSIVRTRSMYVQQAAS